MRVNNLFGEPVEVDNKKLNRVTTSFGAIEYELLEEIAEGKNLSLSEVVNLLVKAKLKDIQEQKRLIEDKPLIVAFDIATRG